MIYDYYCTNCGHKIVGSRVIFDLAQILNLNSNQEGMKLFIKFTPEDLRELVERNEKVLRNGERIRLEISLFELIGYIAQELKRYEDREALQGMTYDEFTEVTIMSNLLTSEEAGQNDVVNAASVEKLTDAIMAHLVLKDRIVNDFDEEWDQNTRNYVMYFWVEPEFFENSDIIYTIRYSSEENPANLEHFEFHKEIRGYCPECKEPILAGSGKYEHILVGFLGAQSAGKTSLFVAMINDLENYFTKLKIKFPVLLSDGKYEKINKAIEYNAAGWAVGKTDAHAIVETYNASLLITGKNRNVILTFVDIAGELCYDKQRKGVNTAAFQSFPLITACHMYMLCTCVSQRGYGEADEDSAAISNTALLAIGNEIYNNLQNPKNIPPLCLTITKVDMAKSTGVGSDTVRKEENPFVRLEKGRRSSRRETGVFNLFEQIETLKTLYDQANNQDIVDSLAWCSKTFENNIDMTYMSMISCSALGKPGRKFNPEKDDFSKGDSFSPVRLDAVWDWILCNIGVNPVIDKYCFKAIPSFGEGYLLEGTPNTADTRMIYSGKVDEEKARTKAVYQMYLNPSALDQDLHRFHMDDDETGGILGGLFRGGREQKRLNIIKAYMTGIKR